MAAYRGFDDVLGTDVTPSDVCRVTLSKDGDSFSVDVQFAVLGGDVTFEAAVDRVVFEHVDLTWLSCVTQSIKVTYHVGEVNERAMRISVS